MNRCFAECERDDFQARIAELEAESEWLALQKRAAADRVVELEAEIERLRDPDWKTYITMTEAFLNYYPADIFTGESGDPGPLFVVAIRKALEALQEQGE